MRTNECILESSQHGQKKREGISFKTARKRTCGCGNTTEKRESCISAPLLNGVLEISFLEKDVELKKTGVLTLCFVFVNDIVTSHSLIKIA